MIDYVTKNKAQGDVAGHLMSNGKLDVGFMRPWISERDGKAYATVYAGGDPNSPKSYKKIPLQTNATLRRDEWKQLDDAILKISESRLGGVDDLISRGLTYQLGNPMGTTVLEYETLGDTQGAELTMDAVSRSKGDTLNYETAYLPIPIIHFDYEINLRKLEASRKLGNPISVDMAERAARKIMLYREQMLFTSTSYAFGGGTIYSYLNHPNRNQVTMSTYCGGKWDESGTTPRQILESVLAMKQAAIDDFHFGPYMLYIPTNYETVMDDDFEDTGNTARGITIRERLKKIGNILDIKVIDTLTADNVVLVQMTSDVVRLVNGMGLTNVQWSTEGGYVNKYKVLAIQVPQIRSDQNGRSGVIHMA